MRIEQMLVIGKPVLGELATAFQAKVWILSEAHKILAKDIKGRRLW